MADTDITDGTPPDPPVTYAHAQPATASGGGTAPGDEEQ